ncbi:MAG: hypothetical protein ABSG69_03020 [Candidatus Acidiferrum sp.]|jgi:hypothetical protein
MNKKIPVIVVLGTLCGMAGCERAHRPENAVEMKMPQGTPKRPQGVKGLAVKPGPQPFGKDDVTQFVQTHRLARSTGDISQLQVESVEFISAQAVTARLQGESTGLPADQMVGFATIRGPIYFTTPPPSRTVAFDTAYALFDAATGNLLMSGTLTKSKDQRLPGGSQPSGGGNKIN